MLNEERFFFGLDQRKRPIYLNGVQARYNKAVPAATRAGKGVTVQVLAPQYALAGDGVYIFDPKRDSKMPRALSHFCARRGLPFQLVDLRYDAAPQVCLFEGLSARQINTLFTAGFDLADTGGIDRVYRLEDREAAMKAANFADRNDLRALPALVRGVAGDDDITKARVFWGLLKELASLPPVGASKGFDLTAPFKDGGMVYVMGDPMDPVVKMAQRMVLVRVLLHIYERPRFDGPVRPICVVLDEFKHLLSEPACDALGMIQDFGGHAMLLFQSLGDLASCAGIPEKRVRGAVLDNCKAKFILQSQNDETAKWASAETCEKTEFLESTDKSHDDARSPGQWRQTVAPQVHPNAFKKMPPMTGALIVDGTATIATVSPLVGMTPELPPLFGDAEVAKSLDESPAEGTLI